MADDLSPGGHPEPPDVDGAGADDLPPGGHPEPPDELTAFQAAVVEVVRGLEPGEVVTYNEVALEAGRPGSAQAVANVLRRVPGLPWWRVVPATGRLYRTHAPTQAPLLRSEGVQVGDDRTVHPPDAQDTPGAADAQDTPGAPDVRGLCTGRDVSER